MFRTLLATWPLPLIGHALELPLSATTGVQGQLGPRTEACGTAGDEIDCPLHKVSVFPGYSVCAVADFSARYFLMGVKLSNPGERWLCDRVPFGLLGRGC
jgi:hypothetical protein